MSTLLIHGSLDEVHRKLLAIKRVIDDKKVNGYPLWSSYEQWQYSTAGDNRVCVECLKYEGQIFNGDVVKSNFPNVTYIGNLEAYPHTHDNPSFPSWIRRRNGVPNEADGCGCKLHLLNPAEAFEAQLHVDKQGAI